MNADSDAGLPSIMRIDPEVSETGDTPGVRIWFENNAKLQVVEDELGGIERQWFGPDHLGKPESTQIVDDATAPDVSLAKAGLETVADYLAFEDEADARENWGDDHVDVLLGGSATRD